MRLNTFAYYADFFICIAVIGLQLMLMPPDATWLLAAQWVVAVAAGLLVWTALEYAVHRWLYHRVPFFKQFHDAHHDEPNSFIGAPPVIGVAIIVAISFLPTAAIGFHVACGATTGMLIGYMAYMLVHHASHHWNPRPKTWLYQLRRHHALHHFHAEEANFGIVTTFWDHAFGTARGGPNPQPRYNAA